MFGRSTIVSCRGNHELLSTRLLIYQETNFRSSSHRCLLTNLLDLSNLPLCGCGREFGQQRLGRICLHNFLLISGVNFCWYVKLVAFQIGGFLGEEVTDGCEGIIGSLRIGVVKGHVGIGGEANDTR